MNDINNDIDGAKNLIKFNPFYNKEEFSKYCSIYPFTNENINGYLKNINLNNKAVLSIAGSGDHLIELLMHNCKSIKLFDINILTKYYISLKIAAIKALDYNEFINFFIIDNNYDVFNEKIYSKIRKYLSEENVIFWDALYTKYSGRKIRKSRLFFKTEESYHFLKTFISYFDPIYYLKIKNLLNQDGYNLDIKSIFGNYNMNCLDKHYNNLDLIILSNIADYLDEIYKDEPVIEFKNYIVNNLANMLTENGIICVAYMFWAHVNNVRAVPDINKKKIREKTFTTGFEEWLISNSQLKDCTDDHLLVYKKTKINK